MVRLLQSWSEFSVNLGLFWWLGCLFNISDTLRLLRKWRKNIKCASWVFDCVRASVWGLRPMSISWTVLQTDVTTLALRASQTVIAGCIPGKATVLEKEEVENRKEKTWRRRKKRKTSLTPGGLLLSWDSLIKKKKKKEVETVLWCVRH